MKKLAIIGLIALVSFHCRKNDGDGGNGGGTGPAPDTTAVPAGENISTELYGYVTNDQGQLINSVALFHLMNGNQSSGSWTVMGNGIFNTPVIVADRYNANTMVETGSFDYINTLHSFPLTPSIRNYARIKLLNSASAGNIRNGDGGIVSLPNGGSFTFGINTFYHTPTPVTPGYFGPEIVGGVHATYLDPEHKDFGIRLPRYLAGDEGQQRKFLKSYGVVTMKMMNAGMVMNNIDFYNGGTAELKLPIPVSMQAGAPDSVATWYLSAGAWKRSGWAKKLGNFYTTRIGKVTAWNFAVPEKGVYMTVNLRTDSSASITNTAVRIRNNNRVIGEGRTDADGNAMFFVPTHQPLTAEVLPDEGVFSQSVYTIPVGAQTKASSVTLKLAGNTPELSTLVASVLNCNNQPVANGIAKIKLDVLGTEYITPIKNGRFATSIWIYGANTGIRIQVTDLATGTSGDYTPVNMFYGDVQRMNLYTCPNSTQLYSNFTFNNISYSQKDDATSPGVYMTATKPTIASPVLIKTTSGNIGFDFSTWVTWPAVINGLVGDVRINGVSYPYDPLEEPILSFSRFDPDINGYIEGLLEISYKDNANVTRRIKCNFKVKRLF